MNPIKETFPSHDECIKHIGENSQCQIEIKHIGQTFCFVCERSYETVSFSFFNLSSKNVKNKLKNSCENT